MKLLFGQSRVGGWPWVLVRLALAFLACSYLSGWQHHHLSAWASEIAAPRRLTAEGEEAQPADKGAAEEDSGEESAEPPDDPDSGEPEELEEEEEFAEKKADLTVKEITFNFAVAVVVFFGVDIGMLYVLKHRDKDIRMYAWAMISSTLSIFMAVMINAALFSFVVDQVIPAPWPRGLGLKYEGRDRLIMRFAVASFFYLFFLLGLSFLGWLCQSDTERMYICNTIIGHLTGFAGIAFYGTWQELWYTGKRLGHHHYAFLFVAFVVSMVLLFVTSSLRHCLKSKPSPTIPSCHECCDCCPSCCLCDCDSEDEEEGSPGGSLRRFSPHTGQAAFPKFGDKFDLMHKDTGSNHGTWEVTLAQEGEPLHLLPLAPYQRSMLAGTTAKSLASWGSDEGDHNWVHEVQEAEDDASGLILSFLLSQVIVWLRTGEVPELRPEFELVHRQDDVVWMLIPVSACILALIALTSLKSFLRSGRVHIGREGGKCDRYLKRFVEFSQTFFAMTMSWCTLRMGQWQFEIWVASTSFRMPSMIVILNAILLTFISWVMIFMLDKAADFFNKKGGQLRNPCAPSRRSRHSHLERIESAPHPDEEGREVTAGDAGLGPQPASSAPSSSVRATEQQPLVEATGVDDQDDDGRQEIADALDRSVRAVRKVIDSLGLLVGICWERAADAAIEAIIEGVDELKHRPVLSKVAAAFLVTCAIFPAWIWYIVPVAKKSDNEHELALHLERIHTRHMSKRRNEQETKDIADLNKFISKKCKGLSRDEKFCVVTVPVRVDKNDIAKFKSHLDQMLRQRPASSADAAASRN